MAWKDWTTGTKVIVAVCTLVCLAVIATFAVLVTRPEKPPATIPSGSSSSAPTPSPTPSPTYQCTTASGPACTKELSEKEAARDKTIADAAAVYASFDKNYVAALEAGGGELPKELSDLLADPAKTGIQNDLQDVKAEGVYYTGRVHTTAAEPTNSSPEWPDSYVLLTACSDARDFRGIDRKTGELKYPGTLVSIDIQVERVNSSWRITGYAEKETSKC